MNVPEITIYVRHSKGCKNADDETAKKCSCRKWLRWTQNGVRHRVMAGTRVWNEAVEKRREIEDQLAGRVPETASNAKNLLEAVGLFIKNKKVEGVAAETLATYTRELDRLVDFAKESQVFTVPALTSEVLIRYAAT